MKNKLHIVAIIQARMQSSRLPGKVLLPLGPDNKSVLWWMVKRAGLAKLVDEVVIATTQAISNIPILDFCGKNEVTYYAYSGDENDVIGRVLACAKWADGDIIVDITSDCPLISPDHINHLINILLTSKYDYISNCVYRDWPDGADIQVYYTEVLKRCKRLFNPKQHVGWNIHQYKEIFNCYHWKAPLNCIWPELGLTLDTPEDYKFLQMLFNKFGHDPGFHIEEVIHYLRNNPELIINKDVRRKMPEEG